MSRLSYIMSSTIILGRDGSNNDLVPLACSSAGVLSTSATLGDLSARQTIADSSTSTSLLCDAAGNLQIDVVSSAIPTGAATQTTLASIDGNITACNTGAVTTASSALPAGAATQTTLASIDGNITACNTGAVTVSSNTIANKATSAGTITDDSSGSSLTSSLDVNERTEAIDTSNHRNITFYLDTSATAGSVFAEFSPDGTNYFTDAVNEYFVTSPDGGSNHFLVVKLTNVSAVQVRLYNKGSSILGFSTGKFRYIMSN